jgi:hypothetical protein
MAGSAEARTYEVTKRGDHRPRACTAADCTLREAVIAANARRGADTILLPSRRPYRLSIRSSGEDAARDGDLDLTSGPLTIVHRGRGTATIDANRTDRVFDIGAARTRLEKLTIRGGRANPRDAGGDGGGISAGDIGDAPLTIVRSRIVDNIAPAVDGNGGGVDTDINGLLKVIESTVAGNDAAGDGGGITGSLDGPMLIRDSTISGNEAGEGGGLMVVGPPARVESSTIASNRAVAGLDGEAGDGAGLYVDDQGRLELVNATVAHNVAIRSGAGIFGEAGGRALIGATTIARNRADSDDFEGGESGGIYLALAQFEVENSIIALNLATAGEPADCGGGDFTGSAPNLISTTNGGCGPGAELVDPEPLLGPLADNGGATATLALLPGSPAIGNADPARSPARDQRGNERDDDPDLGAFERG